MAIQDLIGKEIPPFEMPVERGKIKEFAEAIGDYNLIYRDSNYARQRGFGQIIAPPTFTTTSAFWRTGGTNAEIAGLDNRFLLHGEEDYEYLKPILAGGVLTCRGKITEAYEKAGKRGGTMIFVVFEFTFFNQEGEKVLVNRRTLIQTGGVVKA
jgi:acyl dehydratase